MRKVETNKATELDEHEPQEALKCFEEAIERANLESEEDERYYKLIAITIR